MKQQSNFKILQSISSGIYNVELSKGYRQIVLISITQKAGSCIALERMIPYVFCVSALRDVFLERQPGLNMI